MKLLIGILLAILFSNAVFAKAPTINLDCGKTVGINTIAERLYLDKKSGGGDMYSVYITFVGKKPSKKQMDKALRDCLSVAIKIDATKDILATPWFRLKKGANPNDDDTLNPYGGLKFISYIASTKKVEVQDIDIK